MYNYIPLEQAADILDSYRKPVNNKERLNLIKGKPLDELFPYYGATGQVGWIDSFLTDGEYILLGEDGAPFLNPYAEKAYIIYGKTWVNNHAHILRSKTNNEFLCYYLNYFNYKNYVSGTTRLKLTQAQMRKIPIPNIPSDEQFRIVARIEELFSELEKAVGTLKTTKEQLAVYRQAVLKDAFSYFDKKTCIRNITDIVTSGSRGWAKYYSEAGALFVRIGNLTHTGIDICLDDIQHITPPDNAEGTRTKLKTDDVLVSITADLGSIGFVTEKIQDAYINQHIALVRFSNPIQGKFMAWYLRSEYGQKDLLKNKRGGGKLGLGLDDIRDTPVPIIDDLTAEKMVNAIEERLSVCKCIEQTVDTTLAQADAMRQSILKQVFEGKI
jgi:type I restriction enzyme S subunit